jgi:hypothetical protein
MINFKSIQNDKQYFWTKHVRYKLFYYALGPNLIKKVLRKAERREKGIAPNTIAVMMRKDSQKTKKEVWVMIQKRKKSKQIKIISAWIYPGVSPQGKDIYIPEDVWEELNKENKE